MEAQHEKIREPFSKKESTAFVYARSATASQNADIDSLKIQRECCEVFARENNYKILAYLGDTQKSGIEDHRKEFIQRVCNACKEHGNVNYLIVHSFDRISRNTVFVEDIMIRLKEMGIVVISVSQGTNLSEIALLSSSSKTSN